MTNPRFATLLFCILFASAAAAVERPKPILLQFTDEPATAAGIGILKESELVEGKSEIRIWVGFGIVVPEQMMRFQIDKYGRVRGSVYVHYPRDLSYMEEYAERFRKEVSASCRGLRKGLKSEICVAKFRDEPDWKKIYRKLEAQGLATLPDESELPVPEFEVSDGVAIVVEVRNGRSYRAYQYSNPAFRDGAEAAAAVKILETVSASFIR